MKKIDAAEIFKEEFVNHFEIGDVIRIWNEYANEEKNFDNIIYSMDEETIENMFGEMSAWDILQLDIDTTKDYFTYGVYLESFNDDEILEHIYIFDLFHNNESWRDEDDFLVDYCQEIADECDIDVDGDEYDIYTFKDFIEEYYDYNEIPEKVSQIKKDWKEYLEDNDF